MMCITTIVPTIFIFIFLGCVAQASDIVATDIRIGAHTDKTRFVIDVSQNLKYRVFTLSNPYRVVIDLPEIKWQLPSYIHKRNSANVGLINSFRYGHFRTGLSRVVLDISSPADIRGAFMLPPINDKPHRLVIDLVRTTPAKFIASLKSAKKAVSALRHKLPAKDGELPAAGVFLPGNKPIRSVSKKQTGSEQNKIIIVIDPGHGGIDPGSTSGRVFEKHITLRVAKKVQTHLNSFGKYKVMLTRNNDNFVRLRKRIAIARSYKADLFISLHADAIKNKRVRGLSVYTLSEKSSDKEAAGLAEKANKADVIAGMDLSTESAEVTNILIDLAQRETMNASSTFAAVLVKNIRKFTKTLSNAHRFAGFVVLKAPDVPSVLIEMGFLSNKADEKALLDPRYHKQLANAIGNAVNDYFSTNLKLQR
jgi:N-acetylmuramoyl-L-alanine amidase